MKLFIKVKDGEPVDHPITAENFAQTFPDIDTENLPPEFAKFIRVPQPQLDRFEVYEGVTYEWNGWAFTDVHHARPMSAAEREERIQQLKSQKPSGSWRWNEVHLRWIPNLKPIPKTGGPWRFDVAALDWVIATEPPYPSWVLSEDGTHYTAPTPRPQDGKLYRWDEPTLSWILVDV
jgi:hypothetical protein